MKRSRSGPTRYGYQSISEGRSQGCRIALQNLMLSPPSLPYLVSRPVWSGHQSRFQAPAAPWSSCGVGEDIDIPNGVCSVASDHKMNEAAETVCNDHRFQFLQKPQED